jgi:hypothetical protein
MGYTIKGGVSRSKQYSADGVNNIQVEINFEEIFLTLQSLFALQVPGKKKVSTSQISGL